MHASALGWLTVGFVVFGTTAGFVACSNDVVHVHASTDASTDVAPDTNVAQPNSCVTSPTAAPFPTGSCNSPKPSMPDAFDEALSKIGLDRCSVQQDPAKMITAVMDVNDKRAIVDFKALLQWPLRLPAYGAETAKWLDDAISGPTPVASAVAAASTRRGQPVTDCPDAAWFVVDTKDPAPLETGLAEIASAAGDAAFDPDATTQAVAPIPLEMQRALLPVLRAMATARTAITTAKAPALQFLTLFKKMPSWVIGTTTYKWTDPQLAAWDSVDVHGITQAAVQLASTIEASRLGRFKGQALSANVELNTAIGPIVIHGSDKDTYTPGSLSETAALFIDTGGDDTYRIPIAAATPDRPIALAVDLDGKDLYAYVEKPTPDDMTGHRLPSDSLGRINGTITASRVQRQGSGLLGVGVLWDLGGKDDVYRSLAASQGMGIFGVGVLYDDGGADKYSSEALSQGASAWGVGLLLDAAGDDQYVIYSTGQGFGFTQGVGALVDESGTDDYFSDPGDPKVGGDAIYPNGQLPNTGNTSITQGAGFGHRSDSPEPGYQFPGGLGILRDAKGNDHYQTSVFGQATAFAMGIGMLLEGSGDDVYEGLWYVQGANAHTGVSLFHDSAGSDQYNPTFPIAATSIGVGHDFGSALHIDEGGDDVYKGPGLGLGCGNANGIGIMVVTGGNDLFASPSILSLGGANSTEIFNTPRKVLQTLGVFVKASGPGSYAVSGADAGSYVNSQWSYAPNNTPDGGADGGLVFNYEKSIGIDRPNGTALLP